MAGRFAPPLLPGWSAITPLGPRTTIPSVSTTEHFREQDDRTLIEPIAMRVPDACRFVGISRSTRRRRR
jgi:hypothetical protein